MRRLRRVERLVPLAWLAAAWPLVGCGRDPAAGLVVSVQKQTLAGCFASVGKIAPDPALGLGDCPAAPEELDAIVAGVDRLRIVMDYGAGVEISPGTSVPEPAVVVAFDGVASGVGPRFEPVRRAGEHVWFLAAYDVPAIAAAAMEVSVEAAPDLRGDSAALAVALPEPQVRLQNCGEGRVACALAGDGTTGTVEIEIPSRTGQPVELRSRLDGVVRSDSQMLTTVPASDRRTSLATPLEIPFVDRARVWQIEARWLGKTATAQVALTAPSIELALDDCASPCSATAGVGAVHARLTIPGDAGQSATVQSFVAGRLIAEFPVTTAVIADHVTRATLPIAVPFAVDGATWRLDLNWRTLTTSTEAIALHAPRVTSSIGCAAPCTVKPGDVVPLVITAPRDIQAEVAAFTTSTDLAAPVDAVIAQSTIDEATGSRVWQTALTAPPVGSTWRIQASVAGYPADTILATIAP